MSHIWDHYVVSYTLQNLRKGARDADAFRTYERNRRCKTTGDEWKSEFSRFARTQDMLFQVREIGKSGNRMRMPRFKGGIGRETADAIMHLSNASFSLWTTTSEEGSRNIWNRLIWIHELLFDAQWWFTRLSSGTCFSATIVFISKSWNILQRKQVRSRRNKELFGWRYTILNAFLRSNWSRILCIAPTRPMRLLLIFCSETATKSMDFKSLQRCREDNNSQRVDFAKLLQRVFHFRLTVVNSILSSCSFSCLCLCCGWIEC